MRIDERIGQMPRPTLLGAIVGKSSAYTVMLDQTRQRHLVDLVALASILQPSDVSGDHPLDRTESKTIANAVGAARADARAWGSVPNGREALERLAGIVQRARARQQARDDIMRDGSPRAETTDTRLKPEQ